MKKRDGGRSSRGDRYVERAYPLPFLDSGGVIPGKFLKI